MSAHQYAETTQPSGQHANRDRPRIFEKFPARISHSKRQHDHQPALFPVQAATRQPDRQTIRQQTTAIVFEALTGQSLARVPALPYRHHGGDRLHRAAQNLPAGSGYIMTRDRHSDPTKPNRPPDRGGRRLRRDGHRVAERAPSSRIPVVTIARRLAGCGRCLPAALRNVPMVHQQRMPRHSTPIAQAAGRAV